jgi:hypothetical protein
MADRAAYPQIPSTVWWGVRGLLKRSPSAKVDPEMLGATLGVQPVAARQYLSELIRVGILDEDGKATNVALKWRQDDEYAGAVEELASTAYPEGLITIAPPGDADRQTVVNWFVSQNLGEGAAKNKAATYLLVTSKEPNDAPAKASVTTNNSPSTKGSTGLPKKGPTRKAAEKDGAKQRKSKDESSGLLPLNVNVQIHISADASSDQIESIFAAMRKYLRDD